MALCNALHVAIESDKDGIVDVCDRTNKVVRRASNKLLVQKRDLMAKFHERVAYGIRNAFIEK